MIRLVWPRSSTIFARSRLPLSCRCTREHERSSSRVSLHGIQVVEPLPPRTFLALLAESSLVVSDSGGIQEEATILGRPALDRSSLDRATRGAWEMVRARRTGRTASRRGASEAGGHQRLASPLRSAVPIRRWFGLTSHRGRDRRTGEESAGGRRLMFRSGLPRDRRRLIAGFATALTSALAVLAASLTSSRRRRSPWPSKSQSTPRSGFRPTRSLSTGKRATLAAGPWRTSGSLSANPARRQLRWSAVATGRSGR